MLRKIGIILRKIGLILPIWSRNFCVILPNLISLGRCLFCNMGLSLLVLCGYNYPEELPVIGSQKR